MALFAEEAIVVPMLAKMRLPRHIMLDLVTRIGGERANVREHEPHAQTRAETAEREQRELIINTEHKLRDASRALEEAQIRLEAQRNQLTAIEFRAQAAEAELCIGDVWRGRQHTH